MYHCEDAFDVLERYASIDLALIDGVKGDYLKFLTLLESRMKTGAIVLIDNSYWRGSFLNQEQVETKNSAKKIKELHDYLAQTKIWDSVFMPYIDGLSLLRKI